ncbi:TIGR03773 family transporter-associated surface protein [Actinomycetes bacterium KLBMP 9797]
MQAVRRLLRQGQAQLRGHDAAQRRRASYLSREWTVIKTFLAVALLAAAPAPTTPVPTTGSQVRAGEATVTGRTVVGDGHVDMGARFVNGTWTLQVRDDTVRPSVWRPLSDVVLHAVDAARTTVPTDERFAFLGAAGTPVWVLPQVQRSGVLWPGWNTQDPEVATTINREVTWTLHGVTGPGTFVLFLNGNFGAPQVIFDGTKPMPQQTGIEVNSHVHGNWVFTAPGSYLLDVEMTGTTIGGQQVVDRDTLRIFVGGGDATTAFDATPSAAASSAAVGPTPSGTGPPPVRAGDSAGESTAIWPWLAGGAAVLALLTIGGVLTARRRRASSGTSGTGA